MSLRQQVADSTHNDKVEMLKKLHEEGKLDDYLFGGNKSHKKMIEFLMQVIANPITNR